MKLKSNIKALLFLLVVFTIQNTSAQDYFSKFSKIQDLGGIEEYVYQPNRMNLLLVQDNSAPVVTVQIVYRVGSKHEVSGNTGSTHLLEHLNFKGTPTFNKSKGAGIVNMLQGIGAQMNATTWNDRTNYYETIPSDKIELALHIEADRMRNSLLLEADKDAEMTVVRNEFERGENNPNSILSKGIWATSYMAHTYHHSTIGWRSDIENMPIEVLRDFYNTYYWPDNATLTIIGDFKKDNLFELVDKYFGKITKAPHNMPQPYTEDPEQLGPRKLVIKKPGQQGVINVAYKIPGYLHEDLPALKVLGQILGSGTTSVLSRTFVDEGLALYAYASPSQFREVGLFTIGLGFTPDSNHEALNTKLLETIETIKTEGVKQEAVDRIVAKLKSQTILSRDGSGSIALQLTEAIAAGDWKDYVTGTERLSKVTAEDVKRVANLYLVEDQSTTGYFIPVQPGSNGALDEKSQSVSKEEHGKYFYRTLEGSEACYNVEFAEGTLNTTRILETLELYDVENNSEKNNQFGRETISGIDVITAKTGAKDFVTVAASFPIGSYFSKGNNPMVPDLTVALLDKGTASYNKFQFSEALEKLGVSIHLQADKNYVQIYFKCLTKDLDQVVNLLAEELRSPLFDETEFNLLKTQLSGRMKQALTDPSTQGSIALSQAIYPKGHLNYLSDIETNIQEIENVTLNQVKAFHKSFFGTAEMRLVAVGDVDEKALYKAIKKEFKKWDSGQSGKMVFPIPTKGAGKTQIVTIPQKPSAELFIGEYTGIERSDKDFLPFYIGTSVLGGGFSGRLMQTVRDNDGLTYSIGANHDGHTNAGGYWYVNASFNPNLFQKGLDATMVQIKKWYNEGITQEELDLKKSSIKGGFKVGMSTTSGLANTILSFVNRGLSPDYINQYSKDIDAVTLDDVNKAIKTYIDLDKLNIIKSGSLNQESEPLK